MNIVKRQSRLEARLEPEVHALLKRAAEIEGRSLTDFVVSAASAAAKQTIEQIEVVRYTGENAMFFASLLVEAVPVVPALQRARLYHEALVGPLPGTK